MKPGNTPPNAIGTQANPVTEDYPNESIQYRFCKCSACGSVHQCTPLADFYFGEDGKLRCERCQHVYNAAKGCVGTLHFDQNGNPLSQPN